MPLYFAYGSNMDVRRLSARLNRQVSPMSVAKVCGFSFAFNKAAMSGAAANLIEQPGESAFGLVFNLSEDELCRLDEYEGGYDRMTTTAIALPSGDELFVCTYLSKRFTTEAPSAMYQNTVVSAAEEAQLPQEYIRRFLRGL